MKERRLLAGLLSMVVGWGMAGMAQAAEPTVSFLAGDQPGNWFECANTGTSASGLGCVPEVEALGTVGQKSLAVIRPGESVGFPSRGGRTRTVHTASSLIYPYNAANIPFIIPVDFNSPNPIEDQTVTLTTPGLYVITCSIHPYMFGAVIVDDPNTPGLDLASPDLVSPPADKKDYYISIVNGINVPASSDLATRLLRTFFIATNPGNWQNYASSAPWHVTYPDVPVQVAAHPGGDLNLRFVLNARYGNDIQLAKPSNPATPGVGQVWVNTQFEKVFDKQKPGTATAVNAETWKVERKVALPQINMNNPHNMWTDRDQNLIYQTQWFDNRLSVFDRKTGAHIRDLLVGDAPAHVMTRVDTDQLHVTNNGEGFPSGRTDSVMEIAPLGMMVERRVDIGGLNPHAHWMSHDGQKMVTPNVMTGNTTQFNFNTNTPDYIRSVTSPLTHPLATGMMPDASKYYVANLLDSTISVFDMNSSTVYPPINLIANYDPVSGAIAKDGNGNLLPVGALPIQTPVSPDGTNMVTANTLTGTITVVNTTTDKVVAMLGCDPGCHGVQYGAKKGGGYYAYVSSKFSNRMLVVDPDPNGDGNPADAAVVGTILLTANSKTAIDGTISEYAGMGGQGILPVPLVYNGWVQQWVNNCKTKDCSTWKRQLTNAQKNPGPVQ